MPVFLNRWKGGGPSVPTGRVCLVCRSITTVYELPVPLSADYWHIRLCRGCLQDMANEIDRAVLDDASGK